MIFPFITHRSGIGEQRMLCFMGAGGPETGAERSMEPVDKHGQTLDRIDQLIDKNMQLLDELDTKVAEGVDKLAGRVEVLAKEAKEAADSTAGRTHEYLLSRVENTKDTVQMLIREILGIDQEGRQNIEQQRTANVTDPHVVELSGHGLSLAKMATRLTTMMGRKIDEMHATGDALDASLEDQEGTSRSVSWRKTEGGLAGVKQEEGAEKAKLAEKEKYVPSPSAEKNMGDLVLAMKQANSEVAADKKADGPAAFQALSKEFHGMKPEQQDAFVVWVNEQIGNEPYKAGKDNLSGTLRFDRTA
ncbi:hypothetical protein COU79_00510 [Candidatus Peregrinibacteria bacterium CG10_big_fil_rev_8_21_14_0_10_54_7]|nr:MAG: hypothetical protein COU79_00510 [Candidatus Peregrinibacteria bacterium CG10_big_fil_rev_8_21_14_0_10_54_7]